MASPGEGHGSALDCPVCFETMDVPKCLTSCGHTVCLICLKDMSKHGRLECPICRQDVPLGPTGAEGLATNFALMALKDSLEEPRPSETFNAACEAAIQRLRDLQKSHLTDVETAHDNIDATVADIKNQAELLRRDLTRTSKTYIEAVDRRISEYEAILTRMQKADSKQRQLLKSKLDRMEGENFCELRINFVPVENKKVGVLQTSAAGLPLEISGSEDEEHQHLWRPPRRQLSKCSWSSQASLTSKSSFDSLDEPPETQLSEMSIKPAVRSLGSCSALANMDMPQYSTSVTARRGSVCSVKSINIPPPSRTSTPSQNANTEPVANSPRFHISFTRRGQSLEPPPVPQSSQGQTYNTSIYHTQVPGTSQGTSLSTPPANAMSQPHLPQGQMLTRHSAPIMVNEGRSLNTRPSWFLEGVRTSTFVFLPSGHLVVYNTAKDRLCSYRCPLGANVIEQGTGLPSGEQVAVCAYSIEPESLAYHESLQCVAAVDRGPEVTLLDGRTLSLRGRIVMEHAEQCWGIAVTSDGRYIINNVHHQRFAKVTSLIIYNPNGQILNRFQLPDGTGGIKDLCAYGDLIFTTFYSTRGIIIQGSNGSLVHHIHKDVGRQCSVSVDNHGNLWVGDWENKRVQVYNSNGLLLVNRILDVSPPRWINVLSLGSPVDRTWGLAMCGDSQLAVATWQSGKITIYNIT